MSVQIKYVKNAVFLHLIDAGVLSTFVCIEYFQYSILVVIFLVVNYVIGSIKLIKSKGNVVFRTWSRIQVGYNGAFNEIPEVFFRHGSWS